MTEIRFRHARPADTSRHEAIFRSPLSFGAAEDAIVAPTGNLAAPLLGADPWQSSMLGRRFTGRSSA